MKTSNACFATWATWGRKAGIGAARPPQLAKRADSMNRPGPWIIALCLLCASISYGQQGGTAGAAPSNSEQPAASTVPRVIKFSGAINPQITQTAQTKEGESGGNQLPKVVGVTFSLYELQE
ncbi:MAG: hypothetical protein ACLQOO_14295, partial [Terriglobia bacterium]